MRPRRSLSVLAVALVAASWPMGVRADATLVSASPLPGAVLSAGPPVVSLVFSEPLNRSVSRADVVTPDGHRLGSGPVRDTELDVTVGGDERGVYRVDWVAVSAVDGHVLHGSFDFGVGVLPNQATTLERPGPTAPDLAIAVLRWLEYLGLMGFIGTVVVRRLGAIPPRMEWACPPMHIALAVALAGGIGVVAADTYGAAGTIGGAITYLIGGPPGWERLARVLTEAAALWLCLTGRRVVAAPAVLAAILLSVAGHSAGVRPAAGAIFTDVLHVFSAGMWAGGIVVMATLRPPGGWGGAQGRALLDRFGRVALLAFAATALTGLLRATEELTAVSDLWATSYGIVLSLKSAGVLVMLGMSAAVWRRRVQLVRGEAVVALMVLAATAVLAAYPLPPARLSDASAVRDSNLPHIQALPRLR